MSHFIEGLDRQQAMLLPEHLDDYVDENNAVRAIDAFTDMLDLAALGFNAQAAATGRPGYHTGRMITSPNRLSRPRLWPAFAPGCAATAL